MQIVVISPGDKPKGAEKEFLDDYVKRISRSFKIEILTSEPNKKFSSDDFLIVLDERGQKFSSTEFTKKFEEVINLGNKRVVFLVGGAYGISDALKAKADLIWSFSDQVFPHKLFRIMLVEQIYRTIEIRNGSPYHHL